MTAFNLYNAGWSSLEARRAHNPKVIEQRTENPRVTGSIPVLGTFKENQYGSLFFVLKFLDNIIRII